MNQTDRFNNFHFTDQVLGFFYGFGHLLNGLRRMRRVGHGNLPDRACPVTQTDGMNPLPGFRRETLALTGQPRP